MRIALCPSAYAPDVGGVEEHVRNLADQLVRLGHVVEVWTPAAANRPDTEIIEQVVIRRMATPLPAARFRSVIRFGTACWPAYRQWRSQVVRFRPDIIHVHCFGPNGIFASLVARMASVPLVISLHGETFMDDRNIFGCSVVMRTGLKVALDRAAVVTGCSEVTLSDARRRFGLRHDRGAVVFNGVDLSEPRLPAGEPTWAGRGRRYVIGLGRLVPNKGFDLLIEAFETVARALDDVDLIIGGTGPAAASLVATTKELGLTGRVSFPGRLGRADVSSALQHAAVFVMPSRIEPFGIVILEAWRGGAPVVASRNGGPPEFVADEVDGLLVDPGNKAELSAAMLRVLSQPKLATCLRQAGHDRVADFGWPAVAEKYLDMYRSVATASQR